MNTIVANMVKKCLTIHVKTSPIFLFQPVPTFSFDGTTVIGGSCGGINKHSVTLQWAKDNATVQIDFVNDTGSVSMLLTFAFVPFKVWRNGSKGESG